MMNMMGTITNKSKYKFSAFHIYAHFYIISLLILSQNIICKLQTAKAKNQLSISTRQAKNTNNKFRAHDSAQFCHSRNLPKPVLHDVDKSQPTLNGAKFSSDKQ